MPKVSAILSAEMLQQRRLEKALKSDIADAIAEESRLNELAALMKAADGRTVHSVMLSGIDSSVDEGKLRVACVAFGPVVAVQMAKVGSVPVVPTGDTALGTASAIAKSLHCAVVEFKNQADADAAVATLDGHQLFGSIVAARRATGEKFTRELIGEHLAKIASGEVKEAQSYARRGGAFADRAAAPPKLGAALPSPEQIEVASAAEDILRQMEAAHSLGRQLHPRELQLPEPVLDKNPKSLHDDIHERLKLVKGAIADAEEGFAVGHYSHLTQANQEVAKRSKFRLPASQSEDDPADVMAPTTVAALTARSHRTTKPQVALPAPPEAMKPRPPTLLDALRKRHIRMGAATHRTWNNPETLDGGNIFKNVDKAREEALASYTDERAERFAPLEPEPEVNSVPDSVMALIQHYSPTPGESDDDDESVDSVPDDMELSAEVITVVLELYSLKRKLAEERAALDARKKSLEDARRSAAEYKEALDADQDAAAKQRAEMGRLSAEVKRAEEQLGYVMRCADEKAKADEEAQQAEGRLEASQGKLAELREKQSEGKEEGERIAAAIESAEATAEEARALHEQLSASLEAVEAETREVEGAEAERQRLAEEVEGAQATVAATTERLTTLRDEETHAREEDERITDEIENAEAIAEAGRVKAEKLKVELEQAEKEIAERQAAVETELETLKPVVEQASKAVKGIKTSQLDEMKAMLKPPEGVRLTMESVMILLGKGKMEWADIRKEVVQKGFIDDVLGLDANKVKKKSTDLLKKSYLEQESFTPDKVARASKAAAPLCTWATAQVTYADALRQCKPLTDEVKRLQAALDEQRTAYDAAMGEIQTGSPEGIAKMKEEREALQKRLVELEAALPAVEAVLEEQSGAFENLSVEEKEAVAKVGALRPKEDVLANAEQLKKDIDGVQLGSPEEIAKLQAELDGAKAMVAALEEEAGPAEETSAQLAAELEAKASVQTAADEKLAGARPKQEVQSELENLQLSLLQIVWDQIDGDGNSVLDHSEMLAVLLILEGEKKVGEIDINELFDQVDTNHNNEVDFDEFSSWFLRDYREQLIELGSKGLLVGKSDDEDPMTQLQALTKAVERLETEVTDIEASIGKLEAKEKQQQEVLEDMQPEVPTLGAEAHASIKLITLLPEWCRAEEDAVLNWFGEMLPTVQRPRYKTAYASDPVVEEPESSDEEGELLEGWVPVTALMSAEGEQLTQETAVNGKDITVMMRDELYAHWKECDALGEWSKDGAVFAGKPGYISNLPYEWDGSVYIRCSDFGMTAAMAGVPDTESEEEEEEEEDGDSDEESDDEGDIEDDGQPVQWSPEEKEEFEKEYEAQRKVELDGQKALEQIEEFMDRNQRQDDARKWKKTAQDLDEDLDFVGALDAWEKAVTLVPDNAKYQKARDKALKRCRIPQILDETQALVSDQRFLEAVDTLAKAHKLDPKNKKIKEMGERVENCWTAATLKKTGHKQMENSQFTAAIRSFNRAMKLDPSDKQLVALVEEASAIASHSDNVASSFVMMCVKAWMKALQAEVVASKKRKVEEAERRRLGKIKAEQAAREAEAVRKAAEDEKTAHLVIAAKKIQAWYRGHLGRLRVKRLRARAEAQVEKAAKATERRVQKEKEKEIRMRPRKKNAGQQSMEDKKKAKEAQEEVRLAAVAQFDGAAGLVVEGVPRFDYNSVYLPDGQLDGWPRWKSWEGNMLFRAIDENEWHLDDADSTAPAAYCGTPSLVPVGETEWKCWVDGGWNHCPIDVTPLYAEPEVAEHMERLRQIRLARRQELKDQKDAAKAAKEAAKEAAKVAKREAEKREKERQRAEAVAKALAAKEEAAREALATQVVPSWVVDRIMKVAEPGDFLPGSSEPGPEVDTGPKLPAILDDALTEIHSEFLLEKAAMNERLVNMGRSRTGTMIDMPQSDAEHDEVDLAAAGDPSAETIDEEEDIAAAVSQSLADIERDAEEVEDDEAVVVPPSPDPGARGRPSLGGGEVAEELDAESDDDAG